MKRSLSLKMIYTLFLIGLIVHGCSNHNQDTPHEILQRAREYFQSKRYYQAIEELKKITDETKKNQEYYLLQARASFKIMNFKQAVDALEKSGLNSLNIKIEISYLHLLLGNLKKAKEVAKLIEEHHKNHQDIYLLKGNISLRQNQYDKAEKIFIDGLSRYHHDTKLNIALANLYLLRREFKASEAYYLKAISYTKKDAYAYIALAKYYIAMRKYKEAENILSSGVKKFPNNIHLSIMLSNLYIRVKKYTLALDILSQIDKVVPNSAILKTQLVRCLFYLHRYDEAHTLLQDFKNQMPLDSLIVSGEYYLRNNQLDYALSEFSKESRISNNAYLTKYYLGLTQILQGNPNLSSSLLRESITNYPGFTKSYLLLSIIYLHIREYRLASESAKLAIQLEPDNMNAHAINGIALYFQGHYNESEYEFEIVAALAPRNMIMSDIRQSLKALKKTTDSSSDF